MTAVAVIVVQSAFICPGKNNGTPYIMYSEGQPDMGCPFFAAYCTEMVRFTCSILEAKGNSDELASSAKGGTSRQLQLSAAPSFTTCKGNVPFPLNLSPTKGVIFMGRQRPIELKFRLSADEYALLQSKLAEAGMNRNVYLVRLISGATIFPKDQLIQLNQQYTMMNRLLRGIGTNINQIAKTANTNRATPSVALLADMYQDVQTLRHNLQPLYDETRKSLYGSR